MKYKCEVIRDLMPLCVDDSSSEVSKKIVFEHSAECKGCEKYYRELLHHIDLDQEITNTLTSEYSAIAKKLRKRSIRRTLVFTLVLMCLFLLIFNYALGFRFSARAAAQDSGRLNSSSQLLGTYDWGDIQFFFYSGDANYDTITAVRHWNGWKSDDLFFVWPKYSSDKDKVAVTSGVYYFHDTKGILIFPLLSADEDITKITITAFGQTKSVEVNTKELSVLIFENDDVALEDQAVGYAYYKDGQAGYELKMDKDTGRWIWEKMK